MVWQRAAISAAVVGAKKLGVGLAKRKLKQDAKNDAKKKVKQQAKQQVQKVKKKQSVQDIKDRQLKGKIDYTKKKLLKRKAERITNRKKQSAQISETIQKAEKNTKVRKRIGKQITAAERTTAVAVGATGGKRIADSKKEGQKREARKKQREMPKKREFSRGGGVAVRGKKYI